MNISSPNHAMLFLQYAEIGCLKTLGREFPARITCVISCDQIMGIGYIFSVE
jgi:hypothetical protein